MQCSAQLLPLSARFTYPAWTDVLAVGRYTHALTHSLTCMDRWMALSEGHKKIRYCLLHCILCVSQLLLYTVNDVYVYFASLASSILMHPNLSRF